MIHEVLILNQIFIFGMAVYIDFIDCLTDFILNS